MERHCCEKDCEAPAVWTVDKIKAHPDTALDSCDAHLGEIAGMFGDEKHLNLERL